LLLPLLLSSLSLADDAESIRYVLTANGAPVGERQLTIRYLDQEDGGTVRLLESYTELSIDTGRGRFEFKQRMGGEGRTPAGTFTASLAQTGLTREIQAVRRDEGWRVTVLEPERTAAFEYSHRYIDGTSLSLIDPGASAFLKDLSRMSLLVAETGEILVGSLSAGGPVRLTVAGQSVGGDAYRWDTEVGPVELVYAGTGHLLRYTMNVAGMTVTATAQSIPKGRTFDEVIEAGPITTGGIREEEL
jgi:hypothetical protein